MKKYFFLYPHRNNFKNNTPCSSTYYEKYAEKILPAFYKEIIVCIK